MTAELTHLAETSIQALLLPSAKAAVVASVAWALTVLFRRWMAPRWRHLLWALVFVRMLAPDLGDWRWSALRFVATAQPTPVLAPMRVSPIATDRFDATSEVPLATSEPITDYRPLAAHVATVASVPWRPWEIAGLVWLLGAAVILLLMLTCSLRFHRRVIRGAVLADRSWQALMDDICRPHGWRAPAVLVSPDLMSPVLAGLWRPRIVLPADNSMAELSLEQRRHLLLHELAHWQRRDLWLQTGASLLLALHWFNPLIWLANRRLRAESEACADAWVLRYEGQAQAKAYGSTLVQLVAQSASLFALFFLPGIMGMASGEGELRERLIELALGQRRKRIWTLAALAIIALAGAATFTRPAAAVATETPKVEVVTEVIALEHMNVGRFIATVEPLFQDSAKGSVTFEPKGKGVKVTASLANMAYIREIKAKLDVKQDATSRYFVIPKAADVLNDAAAALAESKGVEFKRSAGKAGQRPLSVSVGRTLLIADVKANKLFIYGSADDVAFIDGVIQDRSLHGKVVDEDGKPVGGADLVFQFPNRTPAARLVVMKSGVDGKFQCDGAVKGELVIIEYRHDNFALAEEVKAVGGDRSESKLVLKRPRIISGKVTGPDGQPVANARVYLGKKEYRAFNWAGAKSVLSDAQGLYQLTLRSLTKEPFLLRVESMAHGTFISSPTEFSQPHNGMDVTLKPLATKEGTVSGDDGKPVAGALIWWTEGALAVNRKVSADQIEKWLAENGDGKFETIGITKTVSDARGHFVIKEPHPSVSGSAYLVAMDERGIARTKREELGPSVTMKLEPWNTMQANFVNPDPKAVANKRVTLRCDGDEVRASQFGVVAKRTLSGTTNSEGRYLFEQILPHSRVEVSFNEKVVSSQEGKRDFASGEKVTAGYHTGGDDDAARIRSAERKVTGVIELPVGVPQTLDKVRVLLSEVTENSNGHSYVGSVKADGRFEIPRVALGHYVLTARMEAPNSDLAHEELLSAAIEFAIGAKSTPPPSFDVGKVILQSPPQREKGKVLPLPKGTTGTVKLKVLDDKEQPVQGANISGQMLYPDYGLVMPSDDLAKLKSVQTDASGEAVVTYPRDLPGRDPIAGVTLSIEKPGLMFGFPDVQTDGATLVLRSFSPPMLGVWANPPAELYVTVGNYCGTDAMPMARKGSFYSLPLRVAGDLPYIVTDQSDPVRWRFSPVQIASFEPGRSVHLGLESKNDSKFIEWRTPGVHVKGKVTGLDLPITGEAWAFAEAMVEPVFTEGEVRPANSIYERTECRWTAWTPVNPDGTFVFPGIPRGKAGVHAVGPGWVMDGPQLTRQPTMGYELTEKDDVLEVTQPAKLTGRKHILVKAPDGSPAEGAVVEFLRSQSASNNAFTARGRGQKPEAHVAKVHREAYLRWFNSPTPGHRAVTSPDGIAVLDTQPAGEVTYWITWQDPKTGKLIRREERISVGVNDTFTATVDLAKGVQAR